MSKYGGFSGAYFQHLDRIRRDTPYLSVFSPNEGKYGPEKTPYSDTFQAVLIKNIESTTDAQIFLNHIFSWNQILISIYFLFSVSNIHIT